MKWLIIQSAGLHDGSDNFTPNNYLRECFALQRGIIENKDECLIWGKRHKNFNDDIDFNSFDYIVILENYEWEWLPDLYQYKKPIKLHWIIDLHCQNPYVKWSKQCNIVLHSTKSLLKNYQITCPAQKHIWFPNAIDDYYFKPQNNEKTQDICFVGSQQNRIAFLQKLNIPCYFRTGIDMIHTISTTKIHFNKSISCDVNYRCFETISLETCLLTNYLPEMVELGFKDGINCIFYNNIEDCRQKINFYLSNNKWKIIAKNGLELSKKHTYTERIKMLNNLLKTI